ncbi:MAG: M1 family aminopeptidase, partial [Clostridia bacterium]|nr:M1 family aminopeptidase [Clostridia bacterium]
STLSVVEANFVHGGMEYPNLVYISNEITDESTYQQVIVHEIAHQWWYSLVGNSEISYAWLDEGLTEYSTILFYDLHPEYNKSKSALINNAYNSYALFIQIYGEVYGTIDTEMNRNLDEFSSEQEYVYVAYTKGMLLFDSLREIIGYDTFISCLKAYFNKYSFQNVTPPELISVFEKVSRTNLESYFNSWVGGNIILLR